MPEDKLKRQIKSYKEMDCVTQNQAQADILSENPWYGTFCPDPMEIFVCPCHIGHIQHALHSLNTTIIVIFCNVAHGANLEACGLHNMDEGPKHVIQH